MTGAFCAVSYASGSGSTEQGKQGYEMTTKTENFLIGKVDYIEQGSKEIGSSARYNVGVRKALIGCLKRTFMVR